MDQKCSYEDCPGSPKFTCGRHRPVTFCEYHITSHLQQPGQHEKLSLADVSKVSSSMVAMKKIGDISGLVSEVMMTGKDMFQEVCSKLCQITDTLAQRQRDLLEIASNVSEDPKGQIEKLGDIRLKLRSRESFAKLVDQHFAEHDATVDFSLFTQDIKGIMEGLKESNNFLAGIKEEAGKDREARDSIVKRLQIVERSNEIMAKELDEKIKIVVREMEVKAKYYAQVGQTEHLENRINQFAFQLQTTNNLVGQINARCVNIEREVQKSSDIIIATEETGLEHRRELIGTIEDLMAQAHRNYQNQVVDLNNIWAEREAAFRIIIDADRKNYNDQINNERQQLTRAKDLIVQEVNQTVQMMKNKVENLEENCLENVNRGIKKVEDRFNEQIERIEKDRLQALEWVRIKIQEIAQMGGQHKNIVPDDFKKFKRQEIARFEEEKRIEDLRKAEEERRIQEEKRIDEERKAEEEIKIVKARKEAEEKRKKEEEDKRLQDKLEKEIKDEEEKRKADFNNLSLKEKKNYLATLDLQNYKLRFIDETSRTIQEINKANDGLYVFVCIFNQIVWDIEVSINRRLYQLLRQYTQIRYALPRRYVKDSWYSLPRYLLRRSYQLIRNVLGRRYVKNSRLYSLLR